MKILQINTVAQTGGVSRVMNGISLAVQEDGGTDYIAYGRGKCARSSVSYKIGSFTGVGFHVLRNFFKGESGFGSVCDTKRFLEWVDGVAPDIIHLHNIHGFYINLEMLFEYIKRKKIPVVWTFHDCWPFTGHCAYFEQIGCQKWKTQCASCKIHRKAYPYALFRDNSFAAYLRKKTAFTGVDNLTIVTPSRWLADVVKESFLKEYDVNVIPNGLRLDIFKPSDKRDKRFLRHDLKDRTIVLGVANYWEMRKGLKYFIELADKLADRYAIVLVGLSKRQKRKLEKQYPQKIYGILRTNNVSELAQIYSDADIFVNPTLEDNFPTTNLEALACGTPVFAFESGGSVECLTEQCGKCIKRGDFSALYEAVTAFRKGDYRWDVCRKRAEEYDSMTQYKKYIDLYKGILEE